METKESLVDRLFLIDDEPYRVIEETEDGCVVVGCDTGEKRLAVTCPHHPTELELLPLVSEKPSAPCVSESTHIVTPGENWLDGLSANEQAYVSRCLRSTKTE